ncbi:hypothetical protein [Microvirga guangxiensis]|uniref:Uncharacterized protein n=1 Tax=Microvirga guangxiensis TaxID=549386 RepID=A0A1G5KHU3_9HYPH|nr:hypothetical protein [Microvirga guangxiensis]SCY99964.1 hypothetical protein SAMN02927923_03314 [Microvirga guangxiensis]
MTMRHAHNDNSWFHLGFLNISRCEPETGTDGRIDRLDIRLTDAVFQASNGGVYRKLRAVAQDGSVHYGSAFAGRDGDFTKAMTLIVYYGVEKLMVPVPVSDLVVGDSSSIDLFATIQAPQAKACPIPPNSLQPGRPFRKNASGQRQSCSFAHSPSGRKSISRNCGEP